jgi:hypothetical protein
MNQQIDKKIDAALRRLAHAQPREGFERRLREQLQRKESQVGQVHPGGWRRVFFAQRVAFGALAVVLGCVAIVVGSVQHSHRRLLPATGVHLSGAESGVGAASGTHLSPQPVEVPQHARPRSERKAAAGRATVSRDAHKPGGVAVPDSAEPQKP